jgi:hypothetical protein
MRQAFMSIEKGFTTYSVTARRKPGSSPRWPGRTSGTKTLRSRGGTSSTRCRPTPTWRASVGRALADRARGRAPPRNGRTDRRRGGGLRPPGGHRQRLLRRDAGARVRRPGTSSALGRRCRPSHRGRPQPHDQGSTRPGHYPRNGRGVDPPAARRGCTRTTPPVRARMLRPPAPPGTGG